MELLITMLVSCYCHCLHYKTEDSTVITRFAEPRLWKQCGRAKERIILKEVLNIPYILTWHSEKDLQSVYQAASEA